MTRIKMFHLRIDLHGQVWELEIYRNASFMFHFDYITSEAYQLIEFVLLGISIDFHKSFIKCQSVYLVLSWWEKSAAFCAGAIIHGNHACFAEPEHGNHLNWLFKGQLFDLAAFWREPKEEEEAEEEDPVNYEGV